jgi:DNA (cytosine-5)-methyltransferase 1
VEYYGNGNPIDMDMPMHTVTSRDREALAAVHIDKYYAGSYEGCGDRADAPLSTATVQPRHSLAAAHVVEFKGQDIGQPAQNPLRTITAGGGEFGVSGTVIEKYDEGINLKFWPKVRELLNKHCGYNLNDDEVLLLIIGGRPWYIADITLRMLIPRELYRAMGFPIDYKIEKDYTGKAYSKSKQVARCGNAVCPPMAEAVVKANLPEWHHREIRTMEELESGVAI